MTATIREIKLANGSPRFRFVIDAGRRPDGKRRQKTYTFDTYAEAEAERDRVVAATRRPVSVGYRRAIANVLDEDLRSFEFPADASGFAYVVLADPYLKIGYSDSPDRRLTELRSRSKLRAPADLDRSSARLWLTYPGGRLAEGRLQWLARNYHAVGEWHWAEQPLREALEWLATIGGGR